MIDTQTSSITSWSLLKCQFRAVKNVQKTFHSEQTDSWVQPWYWFQNTSLWQCCSYTSNQSLAWRSDASDDDDMSQSRSSFSAWNWGLIPLMCILEMFCCFEKIQALSDLLFPEGPRPNSAGNHVAQKTQKNFDISAFVQSVAVTTKGIVVTKGRHWFSLWLWLIRDFSKSHPQASSCRCLNMEKIIFFKLKTHLSLFNYGLLWLNVL